MATPIRPVRMNSRRMAEELRQSLPINTYLSLMHAAAMTGSMPVINPATGKPSGTMHHLPPKERLQTLKYLIDKAMPDMAPEVATTKSMEDLTTEDLENMSLEQLSGYLQAQPEAEAMVDPTGLSNLMPDEFEDL